MEDKTGGYSKSNIVTALGHIETEIYMPYFCYKGGSMSDNIQTITTE